MSGEVDKQIPENIAIIFRGNAQKTILAPTVEEANDIESNATVNLSEYFD